MMDIIFCIDICITHMLGLFLDLQFDERAYRAHHLDSWWSVVYCFHVILATLYVGCRYLLCEVTAGFRICGRNKAFKRNSWYVFLCHIIGVVYSMLFKV